MASTSGYSRASGSGSSGSSGERGRRPPRESTPGPGRSTAGFVTDERRRGRSRSRSPRPRCSRGQTRPQMREKVHREDIPREKGHRHRQKIDLEAQINPDRYKFSHILVKHKGSRRPMDKFNKPINRTKDEAMDLVCDIHERILKDLITFADAAVAFSDCTSGQYEGDIQSQFKSGKMLISFKNTAMALAPGQISNVIETNSGYHILQRRE